MKFIVRLFAFNISTVQSSAWRAKILTLLAPSGSNFAFRLTQMSDSAVGTRTHFLHIYSQQLPKIIFCSSHTSLTVASNGVSDVNKLLQLPESY
jgi:hypothetical protein